MLEREGETKRVTHNRLCYNEGRYWVTGDIQRCQTERCYKQICAVNTGALYRENTTEVLQTSANKR